MTKNCCIFLISGRKDFLHKCLFDLDRYFNKKFNYPIFIFYHGHIYNNLKFREYIESINNKTTYKFIKLKKTLPPNIKKSELFWHLNNPYAKKFKGREGYLHAVNFLSNFMNYKVLKKFDYLIRIDDDSWFKGPLKNDLINELKKKNSLSGTAYTWSRFTKNTLNTRLYLFSWIKEYIEDNKIFVKDKKLRDSLNGNIDNKSFHSLEMKCDFNIYNRKIFESESWKKYNDEFNKFGGIFKYRWGDCELLSLYSYIYLEPPFINFNLEKKNLYYGHIPNYKILFDRKTLILKFISRRLKSILKIILKFISFFKIKNN